jgi:hypothetical protein
MGNRTANRTRVDAQYSYRTEIRFAIRFAANRMAIRMGNRIRVTSPLTGLRLNRTVAVQIKCQPLFSTSFFLSFSCRIRPDQKRKQGRDSRQFPPQTGKKRKCLADLGIFQRLTILRVSYVTLEIFVHCAAEIRGSN